MTTLPVKRMGEPSSCSASRAGCQSNVAFMCVPSGGKANIYSSIKKSMAGTLGKQQTQKLSRGIGVPGPSVQNECVVWPPCRDVRMI